MSGCDEFEKFIRHQEFGKVLDLAGRLRDHRSQLGNPDNAANEIKSSHHLPKRPVSRRKSLHPENCFRRQDDSVQCYDKITDNQDVILGKPPSSIRDGHRQSYHTPLLAENAANLIRSSLVPLACHNALDNDSSERLFKQPIQRGDYAVTDSLIDETIKSLAEELRYCIDLKKQSNGVISNLRIISPSNTEDKRSTPKFKWQTDILQEWMVEHREHPVPTPDEANELSKATGLTKNQVINWTGNAKRRHMNMILKRQRKPRDFLDYLFLATDRERKIMGDNPDKSLSFQNERTKSPDSLLPTSLQLNKLSSSTSVMTHLSSKDKLKLPLLQPRPRVVNEDAPRYTYPRPPSIEDTYPAVPPNSSSRDLTPLSSSRCSSDTFQYHSQEHLDSNTHTVIKPYARTTPKNAEHIFRRELATHRDDRNLSDDSVLQFDSLYLPELSSPSQSLESMHNNDTDYDRQERFCSIEQKVIEKYTRTGEIETPEGSLDGSFDLGEINEDMFDEYYVHALANGDLDIASQEYDSYTGDKAKAAHRRETFNVEDVLEGPYDDSEKDYLNGLL